MSASASRKSANFTCLHFSVAADVESSSEDVVKVPIDDSVTWKEFAARLSGRQTYRREEAFPPTAEVDKVQSQLRAESQKHESDLLESLRASGYQYWTALMTTASPTSGKLDNVNVSTRLEYREKEGYFNNKFSFRIIDGHERRLYI